jgi:hypothetical protein
VAQSPVNYKGIRWGACLMHVGPSLSEHGLRHHNGSTLQDTLANYNGATSKPNTGSQSIVFQLLQRKTFERFPEKCHALVPYLTPRKCLSSCKILNKSAAQCRQDLPRPNQAGTIPANWTEASCAMIDFRTKSPNRIIPGAARASSCSILVGQEGLHVQNQHACPTPSPLARRTFCPAIAALRATLLISEPVICQNKGRHNNFFMPPFFEDYQRCCWLMVPWLLSAMDPPKQAHWQGNTKI